MDLERFLIRISLNFNVLLQLSTCAALRWFYAGHRGLLSCLNCSLAFALYLWKLMEENVSQTSCKVPRTVGSVDLVYLLQAVNT
jgi:hypothetical protein